MPVYTKIGSDTATIANGATTSDTIDLGASTLLGLIMPAAFTGTTLSIHGSADDTTYAALYDSAGTAVSITVAAGRRIYIDPIITAGWPYIKLVSGSAEAAERTITYLSRPV